MKLTSELPFHRGWSGGCLLPSGFPLVLLGTAYRRAHSRDQNMYLAVPPPLHRIYAFTDCGYLSCAVHHKVAVDRVDESGKAWAAPVRDGERSPPQQHCVRNFCPPYRVGMLHNMGVIRFERTGMKQQGKTIVLIGLANLLGCFCTISSDIGSFVVLADLDQARGLP